MATQGVGNMEIETSDILFSNLESKITDRLEAFFIENDGVIPSNFYGILLQEFEESMLKEMMFKFRNNQSKTSRMLGLTRGTTRKLLKKYGIIY